MWDDTGVNVWLGLTQWILFWDENMREGCSMILNSVKIETKMKFNKLWTEHTTICEMKGRRSKKKFLKKMWMKNYESLGNEIWIYVIFVDFVVIFLRVYVINGFNCFIWIPKTIFLILFFFFSCSWLLCEPMYYIFYKLIFFHRTEIKNSMYICKYYQEFKPLKRYKIIYFWK